MRVEEFIIETNLIVEIESKADDLLKDLGIETESTKRLEKSPFCFNLSYVIGMVNSEENQVVIITENGNYRIEGDYQDLKAKWFKLYESSEFTS